MLCLVAQSCSTLFDPMNCSPPGFFVHGDFPGTNTGVGCHALLQGIFPTQELNTGLQHCRWTLPTELVGLSLPFILRHPAWYIGTGKFLFTCEPNISTYLTPEWVLPKLYFSLYFVHSPHSSPPNSSPACLPRASRRLPAYALQPGLSAHPAHSRVSIPVVTTATVY